MWPHWEARKNPSKDWSLDLIASTNIGHLYIETHFDFSLFGVVHSSTNLSIRPCTYYFYLSWTNLVATYDEYSSNLSFL